MTKAELHKIYETYTERCYDIRDLINKLSTKTLEIFPIIYTPTDRIVFEYYGTYEELLEGIKSIEADLGCEVTREMSWYSAPHILFSYRAERLEIWFHCEPNEVPDDLLEGCTVIEHEVPATITYSLGCKNDV